MEKNINKGNIIIYKPKGKEVEIRVKLEKETIWLNVFRSGELDENSVCSIFAHTVPNI